MPDIPETLCERVGEAVREAFLRQRIAPWGGMDFVGINPPVDWAAIGQAAIAAGAHAADSSRKLRALIAAIEDVLRPRPRTPTIAMKHDAIVSELRDAIEEAKR